MFGFMRFAKDRLKLSIVSDRAGCSPETLEQIKNDVIAVISKYVEIDVEGLDIKVTAPKDGNATGPALYANIPIKGNKKRR